MSLFSKALDFAEGAPSDQIAASVAIGYMGGYVERTEELLSRSGVSHKEYGILLEIKALDKSAPDYCSHVLRILRENA